LRHGAPASGSVRLAEFHANAARGREPALAVREEFDRRSQHLEVDSLLPRVVYFFGARRHLGIAAPVNHIGLARSQAQGGADRIQRSIAAADHGYISTL